MKLKLLGKTWATKHLPSGVDEDLGRCDFDNCIIWLRRGGIKSQRQDTLLHEVLHAIDLSLNLEMTETQIHAQACGLLQALRDNPKFTKWLTE